MLMTLSDVDQVFLIILVVLLIGIVLLCLSGIMVVKKDHEAVIEKVGMFLKVCKSGVYYMSPFAYRRVGIYSILPKQRQVQVGKNLIVINYKIVDVKTYHYSGHNIEKVFSKLQDEAFSDPLEYVSALKLELENIGCILLKKGENNVSK